MPEEIDCRYTDELVCPYCGHKHTDDIWELNEPGTQQCEGCEKHFSFEVDFQKTFVSRQVDCLNGAPHDEKEVGPTPRPPSTRKTFHCRACGRFRYDPPIEKKKIVL